MTKILDIVTLKKKISKLKKNKKIILCHGVFDLLHSGHILHFKEIKNSSKDILIVSVTADEFVHKGPNRPVFRLYERMLNLSELSVVDFVVPSYSENAVSNILSLRPNYYVKGKDHKSKEKLKAYNMLKEKEALKKAKSKIIFTKSIKLSSTNILNQKYEYLNFEQKKFIEKNIKFNSHKIDNIFKKIEKLNILIAGEIIIDEYIFGEASGKSSKDPIMVLNEKYTSQYLGGTASIASNLSNFSKNITLASIISKSNEYKKLFDTLKKKTKFIGLKEDKFETISKKRIIDEISEQRMLGLYKVSNVSLGKKNQTYLINKLHNINLKKRYDISILLDYGHGFFDQTFAKDLLKINKNNYVNSQVNSLSQNSIGIGIFQNSNTVVINEKELRNFLSNSKEKLDILSIIFFKKVKCKILVVTSGKSGSTLYRANKSMKITCPAFGNKIIDKTGSGDTFLCFFALMKAIECSDAESLFVASIAAAESLKFIGNSNSISFEKLKFALESFIN